MHKRPLVYAHVYMLVLVSVLVWQVGVGVCVGRLVLVLNNCYMISLIRPGNVDDGCLSTAAR